jgi:hypothetical protein
VTKVDGFVKSQESQFSVIPAKAGIQSFQPVTESLDSGFHRSDDFLHGFSPAERGIGIQELRII